MVSPLLGCEMITVRFLWNTLLLILVIWLIRWISLGGSVKVCGKEHKPLAYLGNTKDYLFYFPHFLLGLNNQLNTIAAFQLNKIACKPRREFLIGADGGQFAIDWFEDRGIEIKDTSPIIFICHGVNGGSGEAFVQHFGLRALKEFGYRPVCYIYRGCAGAKITTPRTYNGGATEDIHIALKEISKRFPKSEIALVGFSMGGNQLAKYLGEFKSCHKQLAPPKHISDHDARPSSIVFGAMTGCPFDYIITTQSCTEKQAQSIGKNCHTYFKKNEEQLKYHKDYETYKQIANPTTDDFNQYLSTDVFGYKSLRDAYADCSASLYLNGIDVPTLFISSGNDPASTPIATPFREISQNENLALLQTPSGGHLGQFYPFSSKRKFDEEHIFKFLQYNLSPHEQKIT